MPAYIYSYCILNLLLRKFLILQLSYYVAWMPCHAVHVTVSYCADADDCDAVCGCQEKSHTKS